MRLLPGWLAFQVDGRFTLDGDASIRRRPVDRIADPLRQMGARLEARDGRFPPLHVHGAPLQRHRLRAAGRERAGEVVRADRRADHRAHDGPRAGAQPRPHRAHAAARRRARHARGRPAQRIRDHRRQRRRAGAGGRRGAGRPLLGGVHDRRRGARPALAAAAGGRRRQLDARRVPAGARADGGDRARRARAAGHVHRRWSRSPISTSAARRSRAPSSRATRCR